jgi:hypothetical protein
MKKTLSIIHPQLAAEWHPTKNGGLTPEQVAAGSAKKAWWKCSNGSDHEWPASITGKPSRVSASPYFSIKNQEKIGQLFPRRR